jgi:hypothetical protein
MHGVLTGWAARLFQGGKSGSNSFQNRKQTGKRNPIMSIQSSTMSIPICAENYLKSLHFKVAWKRKCFNCLIQFLHRIPQCRFSDILLQSSTQTQTWLHSLNARIDRLSSSNYRGLWSQMRKWCLILWSWIFEARSRGRYRHSQTRTRSRYASD